jgi:hypothetical protein
MKKMKKRFYVALLILALVLLALSGLAAKTGKRLTGPMFLRTASA